MPGVGEQEPGGGREGMRETGRRQEDAACSSGAHEEGDRTREGQGWPRMGMGSGVDTSTSKGRTVSRASIPVLFLDIYYRNLDLYSKRSISSGFLDGNL